MMTGAREEFGAAVLACAMNIRRVQSKAVVLELDSAPDEDQVHYGALYLMLCRGQSKVG